MTPESPLHKAALYYAARGWRVHPLKARSKEPRLNDWPKKATKDEAIIKGWWKLWPDANVGLITGPELVVVDVDEHAQVDRLLEIAPHYDWTHVPHARTSRGLHFYFAGDASIKCSTAKLADHIDTKGAGGNITAPPSIHPSGNPYRWVIEPNGTLPTLPAEIRQKLTEENQRAAHDRFNTAEALRGVPEGQRDDTVWKLACKLRTADVPQDMAETLILEAARNCEPPFPERTALEKVQRAYTRYNPKQNGAGKGQSEFWPELISAQQLKALPPDPTRWLWDGCLPVGGASVLVSKPKLGKSTLAANLCVAIARGVPFLGRDTQQATTVFFSLDASLPEITETFERFGLRDSDPIFFHAGAAPREAIEWLRTRIRDTGARLAVVDTLQRLFRFENVNDYSQVTNTIEPLLEAARQEKCHVMFTHHAKKDTGDDLDAAIGSTAIRGLAYTYLHLKRLPDSERRILRSDQRGGKNFAELAVGFDKVTGWLQSEGSRQEVEVDETKPRIKELLEADGCEVTENQIRQAIPNRGWIVGQALREMVKAGDIERTGHGRRGSPYRYSLAATLWPMDVSSPGEGV